MLIEVKETQARQFALKLDALRKIEKEAFESGKYPVFVVYFEKRIPYAVVPFAALEGVI